MPRSKHSEAEIIGALKQLDAGRKVAEVAREVGVSTYTIYAWKAKYGGMDVRATVLRVNWKVAWCMPDQNCVIWHVMVLRPSVQFRGCCG